MIPGRSQALWQLLRPTGLPWVLCLPLLGFGFGHWNRALPLQDGPGIVAVLLAWTLLHAGTMWLNAALDRDEGEVLMGRAVAVPVGIERDAYLALCGSVLVASLAGPVAGIAGALCASLAVLYSHPSAGWKGHPVLGPFVNIVGYGVLSPVAGWSVVDTPADLRTGFAFALIAVWIAGLYFAAQAFQEAEDRSRGYRTLVVTHGPKTTLQVARTLLGAAFLGAMTLAAVGWFPRVALLAAPMYLRADAHVARWSAVPGGGDESWARGLVRRLLAAGGVLMACVTVEYVWLAYNDLATAGLATVAGRPTDPR